MERWSSNRVAVAEIDGALIGIAMSGPAHEPDATWAVWLHLVHVDAAHRGSGAGPALLNAVLDPHESAAWWVADHNPRTHAFMRKHGFAPDGHSGIEDDVRAVRWVRQTDRS